MKYKIGDIVQSKSGRDKGQKYIIWDVSVKDVYLVNGKSKKIAAPKKKNCAHLIFISNFKEFLEILKSDKKINDAYIRKILKD